MKTRLLIIISLFIIAATAAAVPPTPIVTFTPASGSKGQPVTIVVGMRGDVSTLPYDTVWPLILSYEDNGTLVTLPPINSIWTLDGSPGKVYNNIEWSITTPPGWTFTTQPSAAGYWGGSVLVKGQVVKLTATALPSDVLATVTWGMVAQ